MSESRMTDATFGRMFIIMIIVMTVLSVLIAVLASFASSGVNERLDERASRESTASIAQRIAPVGKFSAETVAAAPAVPVVLTVEQVYQSCSACHDAGTLGAPIVGSSGASDWTARLSKGLEILYSNAINGIGSMPAKGGNLALSDDDIKAAVDYMLDQSK